MITTKKNIYGIEKTISIPHLSKETETVKHNALYGYITLDHAFKRFNEIRDFYRPLATDPETEKDYNRIINRFSELLKTIEKTNK